MKWTLLSRLRPLLQRTAYTQQLAATARQIAASAEKRAEAALAESRRIAAAAKRQAELAIAYAAERDQLAYEVGKRLGEVAAEVVAYKRAVRVLAERLGEAHALLHHVEGDTVAEAVVSPAAIGFGRVGDVYQHKMAGHRIRLIERNGAWAFQLTPDGPVWKIFDEDLYDQYVAVPAGDDATVLLRIGGGS